MENWGASEVDAHGESLRIVGLDNPVCGSVDTSVARFVGVPQASGTQPISINGSAPRAWCDVVTDAQLGTRFVARRRGLYLVEFSVPLSGPAGAQTATWEIDFSNQGDRVLATGPETIDGEPWVADLNGADVLELVDGLGLRYTASAASGTFTSSVQTATHLYIDCGDLYDRLEAEGGFDVGVRAKLYVEAYAPVLGLTATGYVLAALYGENQVPNGAGGRVGGTLIQLSSGLRTWKSLVQTNFGFNYVDAAADVWGFTSWGNHAQSNYAGTWPGDWPAKYRKAQVGSQLTNAPLRDQVSRLVVAFATNSTAGTMTAVVERMRIIAVAPETSGGSAPKVAAVSLNADDATNQGAPGPLATGVVRSVTVSSGAIEIAALVRVPQIVADSAAGGVLRINMAEAGLTPLAGDFSLSDATARVSRVADLNDLS